MAHSCFDAARGAHVARACCTNYDLPMASQQQMFRLSLARDARGGECDIVRETQPARTRRIGEAMGLAAPDALADAAEKLHPHPLIWHGNGPGKDVWRVLHAQSQECRKERVQAVMGMVG